MMLGHLFLEKIANRIEQLRSLMYSILLGLQSRKIHLILPHFFTKQSFMLTPRRSYVFLLESLSQRIDSFVLDLGSGV